MFQNVLVQIPERDSGFLSTTKPRNQRNISEFLLLGLTDDPALQPLIFSLFLSMYLVTVLGNLLIILAVNSDSHSHGSIFFFSNLPFSDISLIWHVAKDHCKN
ncbi:Hypothetical predicted protein [Marmota monax]|uniref:G-protein coupled receptors family 1 profile domain-containing protein n=1 Tax=Marmota monax TaxID=9995 RepID=A0A5E4CKV5_MARMO|nr:Hypothetical predicted protein [Marmota monax]